MNGYYGNTDGINDTDKSTCGSISGSSNTGSHSSHNSHGSHSSPPPSSYFYDLQMYSNTNSPSPTTNPQYNLYQNVQEVLYHQGHLNSSRSVNNFNTSNAAAAIHGQRQQQSSPVLRQVEKGGITFVDPFTPSQYSSSPNSQPPQPSQYTSSNYSNSSNTVPSVPIMTQKVHVSTEIVLEPVYATFGTESIFVTCPYCHHTESTDIEQAIGSEALLWACIIPCFGFLRRSKWDTRHRCKNCLNVIGTHYP